MAERRATLEYSISPAPGPRNWRRVERWVAVAAAALLFIWFVFRPVVTNLEVRRWQQLATEHVQPPGEETYGEDRRPARNGPMAWSNEPDAWRRYLTVVGIIEVGGGAPDGNLFVGRLSSPGGNDRVVIVRAGLSQLAQSGPGRTLRLNLMVATVRPGTAFRQPAVLRDAAVRVDVADPDEWMFRSFGGTVDPGDSSRFTVPIRAGADDLDIVGRLADDESVRLSARPVQLGRAP